jgi:hypothetical protein
LLPRVVLLMKNTAAFELFNLDHKAFAHNAFALKAFAH